MPEQRVVTMRASAKLAAILVTSCAALAVAAPVEAVRAANWPAVKSQVPSDRAMEARVNAILARMPVEEKVGQII